MTGTSEHITIKAWNLQIVRFHVSLQVKKNDKHASMLDDVENINNNVLTFNNQYQAARVQQQK